VVSSTDPFGLIGQVLDGQFRVDKFVGEGGFSVVYRGHHVGLDEPIAIKCLKLPVALGSALVESFVRRFRDESRLHYKLSQGNLNIARTLAHGTTMAPLTGALVPYMVLEWLEGRGLAAELEVRRAYGDTGRPLKEAIAILDPAADGLAYAHANGVVHRDVNPGNLFLAQTPLGIRLKVLDFGVAKVVAENTLAFGPRVHTIGQIRIFSPQYAAPEQFDDKIGPIGAWTDVYSFALIAIEMLRDRPAIEGEHLGDFASRALDPLTRPSPRRLGIAVPDLTEKILASAVSLKPQERPQDLGQFWGALKNAVLRDAELGNVAFAEPPPRSDAGALPLSSSTNPKVIQPITTISVEKVPIPVRAHEMAVSAIPNTPTADVPLQLQETTYRAAEPKTTVAPMTDFAPPGAELAGGTSPMTRAVDTLPTDMPPETARMLDAPAHEEPAPRPPVNSGAGALAAAFSGSPLRRTPAPPTPVPPTPVPPTPDPRALGSTRPSAGNEPRPYARPAAPEAFAATASSRSALEGIESRVPPTPPATEVKVAAPPAPIPNVFEGRRRASESFMPKASNMVIMAGPSATATPPPVPVAPTMGPQLTTGPMTAVVVPAPGPSREAPPNDAAPIPPLPAPLATALMARPPAASNTPPALAPSPAHAASQPPANAGPFPPARAENSIPIRTSAPVPPVSDPPTPPPAVPKSSTLPVVLVFFVVLLLSAGAYLAYAYVRARQG
jgi:serine/threonine protein kinase